MHDSESDEALARRAQRDRGPAFEALLTRAQAHLEATLPRRLAGRLRAKVGASDVRQDALISIVAHLDDFENQGPGSFARWVRTIAQNLERSAARRHGAARRDATREVAIESRDGSQGPAGHDPTPSTRLAARELFAGMLAKIQAESAEQAHAFRLVRLEERSFVEAGALLGKSPDAVRKLVERAERVLRRDPGGASEPKDAGREGNVPPKPTRPPGSPSP